MTKLPSLYLLLILIISPALIAQSRNDSIKRASDSIKAVKSHASAKEFAYNNAKLGKKYAKEAISFAKKAGAHKIEAASYNALGICHRNLSEYDSATAAFESAAKIFTRANDRMGYGNARNNLSMTFFYLGEYEKANEILLKVIEEAESQKIYKVLSNSYQNLGIIHNAQERYQSALDNFIRAERYYSLAGDTGGKAGAAINQAFIYFKHLKQYDKAVAIYKQMIPVKEKIRDEKGMGICYNNLAEIFLIKKNFITALHNINKAISIRQKLNDQYGLTYSYYILADIYFQQKKYPTAEKYALLSAQIAKRIGAKKEYSDALKLLSQIQQANKDISGAYTNLVDAVRIKDSLLNRENFSRMAELETKYETEKKEREILQQRAKITENQLKIDRQNILILGGFALSIIAILTVYVFYNRQKLKNVRLEKEAELRDALLFIETQNKLQEQRLQISRDLHDNIGSQLTFIISSLDNLKYGFTISDEQLYKRISAIGNFTRDTITELRDTIWAMNKEEITLLDLNTRISNFIEHAKAASRGIHFTFEIDSTIPDETSLSSIRGINLYRIIQECINNALKHADATEIAVTISGTPGKYLIRVKDNGKGFDINNTTQGNGLSNIKKRAADCGGTVAMSSSPGTGTEIMITTE